MALFSSSLGSCGGTDVVVEEIKRFGCQTGQTLVKTRLFCFIKHTRVRESDSFCVKRKQHKCFQTRSELHPHIETQVSNPGEEVAEALSDGIAVKDDGVIQTTSYIPPEIDHGNGGGSDNGGGDGKFPSGGGGGGGGDYEKEKEEGGDEFGPILGYDQVIRETEARGIVLPPDMLEAAKTTGIAKILLFRYFDLQGAAWPLGAATQSCSLLRDRMLADPSFLFKIGTEIVIDSCCATFAEVQKRGKDFWAEFELYVADLLVGVVVNIALVGMLAPYARIGKPAISKGFIGRMQQAYGALPSSVFEAERPGCKFSVQQRVATYFYKGVLYGSVGFVCGIVGQGIANLIMNAKRKINKSEGDIPIPPLFKSAVLWGVFLAVSSNTRYQVINALEHLVESSPLARRLPPLALAFTVGIRFSNNIYGGMQFVDWARWSGVQ